MKGVRHGESAMSVRGMRFGYRMVGMDWRTGGKRKLGDNRRRRTWEVRESSQHSALGVTGVVGSGAGRMGVGH